MVYIPFKSFHSLYIPLTIYPISVSAEGIAQDAAKEGAKAYIDASKSD
jgi:hypothetical protein